MKGQVLVGCERELEGLERYLDRTLAGQGQVCFVTGQAGSGKTALVRQFVQRALTADASAQRSVSRIAPENANRLRTVLVRSVQILEEVAPDLIGVFVPGATLLGALGRALVEKVGWMDQLDETTKRNVGRGEPVAEQSCIFEQYTAFLLWLSTKTPLILFKGQAGSRIVSPFFMPLGQHPTSQRQRGTGA